MNLFYDTCLDDLVIILFDQHFNLIAFKKIDKLNKKVDVVPKLTKDILDENNLNINNIKSFYLNIGPGSFTGSRIAVTYLKTIAQILKTDIYTTTSYLLINKQTKNHIIYLKSSKYSCYEIILDQNKNVISTSLIQNKQIDEINYTDLIYNFSNYLDIFTKVDNLENLKVMYFHEPQIGDIK
ncbi:hypothetical protein [Mycoplasma miroungirhinis]|uniref:Gcp-like domain-containing protein n=1 Tax=Mycoplasma miroungirhinis TaxID=754516 RepID=A0A6M4JID0_9MOLU|nr:hypothetical protein [Mycoplasma miroungirhinis]QJR44231.1 hypothetical protein HLA92_02175 [Mycoplasma miroungirhinis]